MPVSNDLNVIFDVGGVLLEWNPDKVLGHRFAEDKQRELLKQAVFRHPDWLEFDRGTFDEATAIDRFHQRTGLPHEELSELMNAIRESLVPLPESWALLNELHNSHVPLYCLSNMPASIFDFLKSRYGLWGVFKGIVISGEVGMIKPERNIFEYLLGKYNLLPSRTVFIDDFKPNVEMAKEIGLHGIHFRDARDCRLQLEGIL